MFYSNNESIKNTLTEANSKILLESVCADIKNNSYFDMCNANPMYLSGRLAKFMNDSILEVAVYYPSWRWSKAYGYFDRSTPYTIYVNGYKFFGLAKARKIALLYHEMGHAMDAADNLYSYHHGSNSPAGKENTFQYSLNRFVYGFYGYINSVKKYLPWYKRLFRWIF